MSTTDQQPASDTPSETTTTSHSNPTPKLTTHQTITIRPARFSDLWPAAQTLARAFVNDGLFGAILHPHRSRYPSDPAWWFYQRLLYDWLDRSQTFLVATTPNSPTSNSPTPTSSNGETITGVAQWTRYGPRRSLLRHGWAFPLHDPRIVLAPLSRFVIRWFLSPFFRRFNRAADPTVESLLEDSEPFIEHLWSGRRQESFYLHILGVDPGFHGQGVGRRLVGWGMQRGRREGVSASVVAAEGKDRFYQRCGFRECVGNACEGEGNPMGRLGVPGGNVWFREWDGTAEEDEDGEGEGVVQVVKA